MNALQPLFEACGPWLYILLMGQTMVLAMIIERAFILFFHLPLRIPEVFTVIDRLIAEGDLDRAIKLSRAVDAPAMRVIRAGLEAMREDPQWAREAAEKAIKQATPIFWKRLLKMAAVALAEGIVGGIGTLVLQADAALAGPGWLGLPQFWTPALYGGTTAVVALVFTGIYALRAWTLATGLGEIPPRVQRWAGQIRRP